MIPNFLIDVLIQWFHVDVKYKHIRSRTWWAPQSRILGWFLFSHQHWFEFAPGNKEPIQQYASLLTLRIDLERYQDQWYWQLLRDCMMHPSHLPKFIYKCNQYHLSIVTNSETQLRGPNNLYSLGHSGAPNWLLS